MDYLSDNKKLKYLSLVVVSLWFFNTMYIPDWSFLIGILASIVYIYYDITSESQIVNDVNVELNYKLNSLLYDEGKQPPDFFYTEPDLILFFYSIREYRIHNRDSYLKAINCANNVLKIRKELENDFEYEEDSGLSSWQTFGYTKRSVKKKNIKNLKEMNELARSFATKSLNYMHSFAVSLPSHFKKKLHESIERYHLLMKRITDDVYFHCKKYSNNPLLTQDYGLPKPFTKISRFDFFT